MATLKVNREKFEELKNQDKVVLLDFYADWCNPCRMLAPVLEQLSQEHPEYIIGKINVDDEPELSQAFGVVSIPMLVVMRDGKVVEKTVGARPKGQLLSMLERA